MFNLSSVFCSENIAVVLLVEYDPRVHRQWFAPVSVMISIIADVSGLDHLILLCVVVVVDNVMDNQL